MAATFEEHVRGSDAFPPIVVAELSANHNGSQATFLDLIRSAAACGAHAVKFQTYTADTMTLNLSTAEFSVSADHELWGSRNLYSLYQEAFTPWEWQEAGFELAKELGIFAFSSPFDQSAIDFLEPLDPCAYKIASLELLDHELIVAACATGRPVIISTGAATTKEVAAAVEVANAASCALPMLTLCTSSYPAAASDSDLRTIPVWAEMFGIPIGLSDHTVGIGVSLASVALGARLIERHFTLSRDAGGVDSAFSMEPAELTQLVHESRNAWEALGGVRQGPRPSEAESRRLRRSLYVAENVQAGDLITRETVRAVRPGNGMAPAELPGLIGKRFAATVHIGTPMSWDLVAGDVSPLGSPR